MLLSVKTGEAELTDNSPLSFYLVFLDEIQECPRARTAIKFLVEDGRFDSITTKGYIQQRRHTLERTTGEGRGEVIHAVNSHAHTGVAVDILPIANIHANVVDPVVGIPEQQIPWL